MRQQTLVWTALPGIAYSADVIHLSVFVTPRLVTDEGGGHPTLDLFPDFVNWPQTVGSGAPGGPISFTVTFAGKAPVHAQITSISELSAPRWAAVFAPPAPAPAGSQTGVESYQFTDFSTAPVHSYSMTGVQDYVAGLYSAVAVNNPTQPPVLTVGRQGVLALPSGSPLTAALDGLTHPDSRDGFPPATGAVADYYRRPPVVPGFVPTLPTLDFHAAVSSLGAYPALLREFGLVFDLVVPNPGVGRGTSTTVSAVPTFTSAFTGAGGQSTVNVSPLTACTFNSFGFLPTPLGTLDYVNGMLDLGDATRFSVTDLDLDGSAEGVNATSQDLKNLQEFEAASAPVSEGATVALTLPSLRSLGPTIVRSGWAQALQTQAARQAASQAQLESYLAHQPGAQPPTFFAEDLVRGHRVDVYTASEASPTWRSLFERAGSYTFGNPGTLPLSVQDEGAIVPAPTQAAGTAGPPPPDLWVNESMARWTGWSLAAPRVGKQINSDGSVTDNAGNPPAPSTPDGNGAVTPQMSASFAVPPGTLPKLRFGSQYQFRARAVDLAGNSQPLSSVDASTASPTVTHLRYEPVTAPVLAANTAYGPGQATLLLALIDDDVNPVAPLGRWLLPPKAVELLVEEHGLLDGFALGSPPDPTKPPAGDPATYAFVTAANDAKLTDIAGVRTDPLVGAPYFPSPSITTPWLPDPLTAGAAMVGLPGDTAPTVRPWAPGPWPALQPILLNVVAGTTAGHSYQAAAGGSGATETVTLPPGDVYNVRISSALTAPDTLGVWQWILTALTGSAEIPLYTSWAGQGQIWTLTPYTTLRIVHATRLPLIGPTFEKLAAATRNYGDTTVTLHDDSFRMDPRTTGSVDVAAVWADPLDNPGDPGNDPATATVPFAAAAFKLTVPDPGPLGAPDAPGQVIPQQAPFALTAGGAVHDVGDTKHHRVGYTATGSSRFAELFQAAVLKAFPDTTPVVVSPPPFGLNPAATSLFDSAGAEVDPSQFTVDPVGGTVALVAGSPYLTQSLEVSYEPAITRAGPTQPFHVLSSARPAAPQVSRVVPAWRIPPTTGKISKSKHLTYERQGNYLRVYLDRPWWSSGADEMLGVVVLPPAEISAAPVPATQTRLVTMLGLDPISLADPGLQSPSSPDMFAGTAKLGHIQGRPPYANPPLVTLKEDTSNEYQVFPYAVTADNFDPATNQWYVDVQLNFGPGEAPPPGYFVRLALVRFQPYAVPGAEVSPVVVSTFAQPVVDRSVFISELGPSELQVAVEGPAYQGFRPVLDASEINPGTQGQVDDIVNPWAPDPYSLPAQPNAPSTSGMIVEVQVQDTSGGLAGDLAWVGAPGTVPLYMTPTFRGGTVTWNSGVPLPSPLSGMTKMRLRFSEIDYYQSTSAPTSVDTTQRRPFVCHIPVN